MVGEYLSDDEYAALQWSLAANPSAGDIVKGTGGVRKIRWGVAGRGKRGGVRVIYYARTRQGEIWMLTIYAKNVAESIAPTCCGRFGKKSMAKTKRDIGSEILDGLREIKRGEHGRVTKVPAVADVRRRSGLSQSQFARLLGVSVRTLQEWEQGRRAPSGAARTLILLAAKDPQALADVA